MKKILFNTLGIVALALGALGVVLPLLPTTPFLLLACACFMRGSLKLHQWMLSNKVFGTYLNDYQSGRGLSLQAKATVLAMLWATLAVSAWHIEHNGLRVLLCLPGIAVTIYILRIKTRDGGERD
ncbi:MAG: YbaN family protein [Candidimonas sp.]